MITKSQINEQLVLVIWRVLFSVQTKEQMINIWVKDSYRYILYQERSIWDDTSRKEDMRLISWRNKETTIQQDGKTMCKCQGANIWKLTRHKEMCPASNVLWMTWKSTRSQQVKNEISFEKELKYASKQGKSVWINEK